MLANDWPPLFEVAFHIVLDVLLGVFLAYSVVLVGSTTSLHLESLLRCF